MQINRVFPYAGVPSWKCNCGKGFTRSARISTRVRIQRASIHAIAYGRRYHRVMRKIIHIDMDAFYASVEQRDNK